MLKERNHFPPESTEHRHSLSEEVLKSFLEKHVVVEGEGASGLILRFEYSELPPEVQALMDLEDEDNPEGSLSVKALKIFERGRAQKEFEALQEAREIVNESESGSKKSFARVPRGISFFETTVGKQTEDLLNRHGASIHGGQVGLIVMDYIEGKDLAAVLHEELMKRSAGENDESVPDVSPYEFEKIYSLLEKKGFTIDPAVVDQIKNTIEALHARNVYHNDIHPRNIIVKDGRLENGKLYLIDFEKATHGEVKLQDAEGDFVPDGNILSDLGRLTKTTEQKHAEKDRKVIDEWEQRAELIAHNPRLKVKYENFEAAINNNDPSAIENMFAISSQSDAELENFFANLLRLSETSEGRREMILGFIEKKMEDKKTRTFVAGRLRLLKEAMEMRGQLV